MFCVTVIFISILVPRNLLKLHKYSSLKAHILLGTGATVERPAKPQLSSLKSNYKDISKRLARPKLVDALPTLRQSGRVPVC